MNDRILLDPDICHGKPVIRGTRTPVAIIVGSLAGGMSFEEVQREYELTIQDIRAALKFAGELVRFRPARRDLFIHTLRSASNIRNHGRRSR